LRRWLPVILALVAGCRGRGYDFVHAGDGGKLDVRRGGGGNDPDAEPPILLDGARPGDVRDGCAPRPEECNGLDDNCNGLVDETFELNTDPQNCGRCGVVCKFANAATTCSIGRCHMADCEAGFVDLNRMEQDGCECQVSNGGVEICDGKDNDCNGVVDDGFDVQTSVDDCGTCGRRCEYPRAAATCTAGMCAMGACDPGFIDLDHNPRTGCEYPCVPSNGGVEVCDGQDNNCDGTVDESDERVGQRCWPEATVGCDVASGQCRGGCAFGTYACLPGGLVCQKAVLPQPDICDGMDNDCDGVVDEDFDLQNDPRACGTCNHVCEVPNAVPGCAAGSCVIRACRTGFVDLNGLLADGCEYACTPDGPEVCDGKDNDCDGLVDTDDPDLLFPMVNFCSQVGECGKGPGGSAKFAEATFPSCVQATGAMRPDWICNYPPSVQLFAPNQVLGDETWCDGLDNDCDGLVDEHAAVGGSCLDNSLGECKKTGVFRCQADKTLAAACDTTGAVVPTPHDEVCDGKDNDCDGLVDESWDNPPGLPQCPGGDCKGIRDDLVHVTAAGADYYVYRNEATRVDATAAAQGTLEDRSCSRTPDGVPLRPWTLVNLAQARAACQGAGMRLCRVTRVAECSSSAVVLDEWGLACAAGLTCPDGPRAYPYGCSYDGNACNGVDRAAADAVATGSLAMCVTPDLDGSAPGDQTINDMSGNVAEWTDDCRSTLADGSGRRAFTLRGGSFTNVAGALRCDFMALVVAENFSFNDTGFRCCSSCAPGLADCGSCVSLATDAQNCGACGHTCAAGETCQNGFCR
jgi:Sulfatase-modifying factor enzyme 1/Putative metal-binding motif